MTAERLETWADAIEAAASSAEHSCVTRVVVVRQTASTQDAAARAAAGSPGLVVVAGRQTSGRGRLGRAWADTSHLGVAATFTFSAAEAASRLSLVAGLAACMAVEAALGPAVQRPPVGIRWPNDVVEVRDGSPSRKISGVLIEVCSGVALVGIGINVLQDRDDWPAGLADRAVSLRQLGSAASRLEVVVALVRALDAARLMPADRLAALWQDRNVLAGSRQTFVHEGRRITGTVLSISPECSIRVRMDDGSTILLPALSTSLEH